MSYSSFPVHIPGDCTSTLTYVHHTDKTGHASHLLDFQYYNSNEMKWLSHDLPAHSVKSCSSALDSFKNYSLFLRLFLLPARVSPVPDMW